MWTEFHVERFKRLHEGEDAGYLSAVVGVIEPLSTPFRVLASGFGLWAWARRLFFAHGRRPSCLRTGVGDETGVRTGTGFVCVCTVADAPLAGLHSVSAFAARIS